MKKQPTLIFTLPEGFHILRRFLSPAEQHEAVTKCRALCRLMPLYAPRNQYAEFNVKINSFGDYGWHSDERGYRYITQHPHGFCVNCCRWFATGGQCAECGNNLVKRKFPPVPEIVRQKMLDAAHECGTTLRLETVLMNYYAPGSGRLGKHRDDTEDDRSAPIITISLGDDCIFGIGGAHYGEACEYIVLNSGDVIVMAGASRMFYHEVSEIISGTSSLLADGGRISLTGRQVKPII